MTESQDWVRRAACRDRAEEMMPDDEQVGAQRAKKICSQCPVTAQCLATAESISDQYGASYAQGIWAGLTMRERATLAALSWPVRPCPACGYDFVPINSLAPACSGCEPKHTLQSADYRARIEQLIAEGLNTGEIAVRLRLRKQLIDQAIARWGLKSLKPNPAGKRATHECGTPAAKSRHHRAGQSTDNCACRFVVWHRGKSRQSSEEVKNKTKT